MSEVATESVEQQEQGGDRQPDGWSLLLPLMLGGVAWGASTFLPDESFIGGAESFENWSIFGQRVLHDILIAAAVLSVSIMVSVLVPQIGLAFERLVLRSNRNRFLAAAVLFAFASSTLVSWYALGGLAHVQDEVAILFQSKVLASGRLFADTPALPEFFDQEYILFDGPRWYGKYFLGPSLALVPGVWLGAVWLMSPLFGGLAVLLTFYLGRALLGEKIARVATLLFAVSPFRLSLCAMMMAHPVTMLSLALAAAGAIQVVDDPRRWGWAMAAGAGLGYAANSRPLTAAVLGAVMGVAAMLALPWRRLRWQTVAAFALPLLVLISAYFGYNKALTGDARLTPFEKWCPKDRLGFGPDVGLDYWLDEDRGHSFRKALLHNTFYNLDTLADYLAGLGSPSLVLLALGPWACKRRRVGLVLAAAVLAVMVAYFFYYTPSTFAGQARYWSEAMPAMLLLVAVGLTTVRRMLPGACRVFGVVPAVRTGRAASWLALGVLLAYGVPKAYGRILDTLETHVWERTTRMRDLVEAGQIRNAVVFIRSSHYRNKTDYRSDAYANGFAHNEPDLQNSVVFARDLGPEKNIELLALYPGRQAYRVDPYSAKDFELEPLEPPPPR